MLYFRSGSFIYGCKKHGDTSVSSCEVKDKDFARYQCKVVPVERYDLHGNVRHTGANLVFGRPIKNPKYVYQTFSGALYSGKCPKNYTGVWFKHNYAGMLIYRHSYIKGKRHGEFVHYNPVNGIEMYRQTYQCGLRHGPVVERNGDGCKTQSQEFKCDLPYGPYDEWYENGLHKKSGSFVCGQFDGEWFEWNKDGSLKYKKVYKCGTAHGDWHEYENGKIVKTYKYRYGKLKYYRVPFLKMIGFN